MPSPKNGAGAPDEGRLVLTPDALRALFRSITELGGRDAAEDLLFRVGRSWGERDAELTREGGGRRRGGLAPPGASPRLEELGLATVTLDVFELDREANRCLVRGLVLDDLELRVAREAGMSPDSPACGLTVGYLTGLTAAISGLDVICSPFRCQNDCAGGRAPARVSLRDRTGHLAVLRRRRARPSWSGRGNG